MFLGEFPAYLFPLLAFASGASSIIICYYISQYLGHEKPFPDTWISATAQHYPEFVFFRVGTITGAVFLLLSHVLSYFWMFQSAIASGYNIRKYYPAVATVLGIAASLFLMGSTATIDTGIHNTNLHVLCASSFFIFSILSCWYYTFVSYVLFYKAQAGTKENLFFKLSLSLAFAYQAYLEYKYSEGRLFRHELRSPETNTLEYTLAFSILAQFLLVAWDLGAYKMAYVSHK